MGNFNYIIKLKEDNKILDAIKELQELLRENPQDETALSLLGNLFKEMGKYKEACLCYETALSISTRKAFFGENNRYKRMVTRLIHDLHNAFFGINSKLEDLKNSYRNPMSKDIEKDFNHIETLLTIVLNDIKLVGKKISNDDER